MVLIFALLGGYQEVQQQWLTKLPGNIPLSPLAWLSIFLALCIIFILEAAYRRIKAIRKEHKDEIDKLQKELDKIPQLQQEINSNLETIQQQVKIITGLREKLNQAELISIPIMELRNIKRGDIIKNKEVNVSMMFQQLNTQIITDVTFDHCKLNGPAVLALVDNCLLKSNSLGKATLEDMIIRAETNRRYVGICGLLNCNILYCDFDNIGLLANDDTIQKIKKGTTTT